MCKLNNNILWCHIYINEIDEKTLTMFFCLSGKPSTRHTKTLKILCKVFQHRMIRKCRLSFYCCFCHHFFIYQMCFIEISCAYNVELSWKFWWCWSRLRFKSICYKLIEIMQKKFGIIFFLQWRRCCRYWLATWSRNQRNVLSNGKNRWFDTRGLITRLLYPERMAYFIVVKLSRFRKPINVSIVSDILNSRPRTP